MFRKLLCGLLMLVSVMIVILLSAGSCGRTGDMDLSKPPGPDFSSLFNGNDFTGWNIEPDDGAWVVENGMIHCGGEPRTPYLIRTEKEYENFEFYAEFNASEGCNSGIFFHVPIAGAGRESRIGFETQIDYGQPPGTHTSTGAIYDISAPLENVVKPAGTWNQYRIVFDWPVCKVWLNGTLVQDIDFTHFPRLKYRLQRGTIGLSNHGHTIDYRNIWIRELPDKEEWTMLFNGSDLSGWTSIGDADWHVENGAIVATGGEGYLVTDREFENFHFQAYADNDTLQSRSGCFYYRWKSVDDPGYSADFFDFDEAKALTEKYGERIPESVTPPWKYSWLLYQIISTDRESLVRTGGDVTSNNKLLGKVRPGKLSIYHTPDDGVLRVRDVRIKPLDELGI